VLTITSRELHVLAFPRFHFARFCRTMPCAASRVSGGEHAPTPQKGGYHITGSRTGASLMQGRRTRSIVAISAASLVAQPLIVLLGGCAQTRAVSAVVATSSPNVAGVGANPVYARPATVVPTRLVPFTLLPVALIPVTALSPAMIETQRGAIEQIMITLGKDEDQARQMATELTAEDLAVLLANPKMMQKAGDLGDILIVVLIVGGIVVLALAADSAIITA
jgi:hypothetical protein